MKGTIKQLNRAGFARGIAAALALCLALAILCLPASADAPRTQITLRVGFPTQPGFSETLPGGGYTGYTYEYLQKVAQYTGWEYEFVPIAGDEEAARAKALTMLENGEIDLLGSVERNEQTQALFLFPRHSYGVDALTLRVLSDHTSVNETSFLEMKSLRAAVLADGRHQDALADYCQSMGVTLTLVPCQDEGEQLSALQQGRADALLSDSVSGSVETRVVAEFSERLLYLAVRQGRPEIAAALDDAIGYVNDVTPEYSSALHRKYFERPVTNTVFSETETAWLLTAPTLRIAVETGKAPVQYRDPGTGEIRGISLDVLDAIAEHTGLRYELVEAGSYEEMLLMLRDGRADLAMGVAVSMDVMSAYDISLTESYIDEQMVIVAQKGTDLENIRGKRLALVKGAGFSSIYLGETHYYATSEECLDAVRTGEADYTYALNSVAEYYIGRRDSAAFVVIPQPGIAQSCSFALSRPVDPELLNILNKSIVGISEIDLQAIVRRNSILGSSSVSIMGVLRAYPMEILIGALLLAVLVFSALYQQKARTMRLELAASQQRAVDNERYRLLSDLSRELLYEYRCREDVAELSETCAQYFHCERVHTRCRARMEQSGFGQDARQWITGDESGTRDICLPGQKGGVLWLRVTRSVIYSPEREPLYIVGKLVDITQEKLEQERLVERAQFDGLTGIYNAAAARELIGERLCADDGHPRALMLMDVDYFKSVNDRLGHYAGDQVLVGVAHVLRGLFGERDLVGRLGGDEFVVYLHDASDLETVRARCALLCARVREITLDTRPIGVTMSVGVVRIPRVSEFSTAYRRADHVLYEVKRQGRDGYRIEDLEDV